MLSAMAFDSIEPSSSGIAGDGGSAVNVTAASDGGAGGSGTGSDLLDPIFSLFENGTFQLPNGDWSMEHCLSWNRPHHLYFQLGNALFLIAFLLPHGSYGLLCARFALVMGSISLAMWGYLIECSADVVAWNASFLIINIVYLLVLLYRLRPVRFDKEIEAVSFS